MATDVSSPGSLIARANTLKNRIGEDLESVNGEAVPLSENLRGELLEVLDKLVHQASEGSFSSPIIIGDTLGEQIVEVLDASMSAWQASVSSGFAQSVAAELEGQLKLAERLNSQLREQEERLARQQSECQALQVEHLRRQAKLSRQSGSIAKSLRARKAQMLLEVQQQRQQFMCSAKAEVEQQIRGEVAPEMEQLRSQLAVHETEASTLREELAETRRALAEFPNRLEDSNTQWRELLANYNARNAQLQAELRATGESLVPTQDTSGFREHSDESELIELREQLEFYQIEIDDLSAAKVRLNVAENELDELRKKYAELEELAESERLQIAFAEDAQRTNRELTEETEYLKAELNRAQIESSSASEKDIEAAANLERRLAETQNELSDLRAQNADLASQLAKRQIVNSGGSPRVQFDQESLSWEERKALIIKQLEDDSCGVDNPQADQERKEIERVLETTQQEVDKRDREIEELRSIIEHQSDTKQGVAIGAAAIAQMLDSDELIAQERKKLKEIQQEWEEKLRQAEIDLSMERAKLARERTQLESELEVAKSMQASTQEKPPQGRGKTRKWLDHLGLSEENPKK